MPKSKPSTPTPTPTEELATIDPTALSSVSGGTKDGPLLNQLNGILDSIKTIRKVGNEHGINPQEMMLFMMLLQQRNQPTTVTIAPAPWWIKR